MGPFDLDCDLLTGKKIKTTSQQIRSNLTPAMKGSIKEAVGSKCEKCGRKGKLQIDHIKEVSKGGTNVGSNLVALCANCHYEKLTQAEMKKIVSKRSKKVKQQITNILRNRKKVEAETAKKDSYDPFHDPFRVNPFFEMPKKHK